MKSSFDILKSLNKIKDLLWKSKKREYLFNDEASFRRNLYRMDGQCGVFITRELEGLIDHERAHFNKTVELGYSPPKYGLQIVRKYLFGIGYEPEISAFIEFTKPSEIISLEDRIKIYLAPKKPSPIDMMGVDKCQKILALEVK
jgi:hypothetical protein